MDQDRIVEFLQKHSEIWTDAKRLKALLSDCIPDQKGLRNVLVIAYEEDIVKEFSYTKDINRSAYKYTTILKNSYSIEEKTASLAVDIWRRVLKTNSLSEKRAEEKTRLQIELSSIEKRLLQEEGLDPDKYNSMRQKILDYLLDKRGRIVDKDDQDYVVQIIRDELGSEQGL